MIIKKKVLILKCVHILLLAQLSIYSKLTKSIYSTLIDSMEEMRVPHNTELQKFAKIWSSREGTTILSFVELVPIFI